MEKLQVVTFGDAVLDIVVRVPPSVLEDLRAEPGGCVPVEQEEMEKLLDLPEVQAHSLRCGRRPADPAPSPPRPASGIS